MKAPVLFLTFNRLDTTKQVFQRIAQYQPSRIYLASDGPRSTVPDESDNVEAIRAYLIENIQWDCEVNTLFRSENLGCKMAVSGAISWFFEHEEQGIILEDDCLPAPGFFDYCAQMLDMFRDDERVMQVSGLNFLGQYAPHEEYSYFFSKYGGIWGWASWRRAWQHFSLSSENYVKARQSGILKGFLGNAYPWRMSLYKQVFEKDLDTWDYQWSFARASQSGLSVVPHVNLVENIGFGLAATHTKTGRSPIQDVQVRNIDLGKLTGNPFIVPDGHYDKSLLNKLSKGRYLFSPILKKLLGR